MRVVAVISLFFISLLANPLQEAIDRAKPYDTIKLHNGTYRGPISIDKPLVILGVGDAVSILGNNEGSVVRIRSSDVTLKNLIIRGSGSQLYSLDAAISMKKVSSCKIIACRLEDVLYGIDMDMVENSLFKDNFITSKELPIQLRGDALKLYYSHHNSFLNNTIEKTRDVTLNYSHNNSFLGNRFFANRFATHIALSHNNILKNNLYKYNAVSIMLMGAKDTNVSRNTLHSARGAAGIGVMIGAVENLHLQKNSLRYNAKAIYVDGKEKERGIKRFLEDNEIAYNAEAFHFHATIRDNQIVGNSVFGNIEDVVKDTAGGYDASNVVAYNYWDRYSGFDKDGDGIGDTPYEVYQYADKLWHHNKAIKFFYASPLMTLLDFMLQLAPFVEPTLIMRDEKARISP